MRSFVALLVFVGCGASFAADSIPRNGNAGGGSPMEIEWRVATNRWPEKLWVYKVVPQQLAPVVLSNLLSLSGFTAKDRAKVPGYILENDKLAIFYGQLEGTMKHLTICPTLGFVDYHDPDAEASSQLQKTEGVPDEKEAAELGLKYLRLLGIDVSQIAKNPETGELDLHWQKGTTTYTDQVLNKDVVLTNNYGVLFARQIDEIKVHGFGGMDVSFGNNAKVLSLQLCWRNVEPHKLETCFTLREIAEHIKHGTVSMHPLGTKATLAHKAVRKLTITKATPLYEGKYQNEPMEFVHPYATFEGVVDTEQGGVGVWFEHPLRK